MDNVAPVEGWEYNPGAAYAGEMKRMLKEKMTGLSEKIKENISEELH